MSLLSTMSLTGSALVVIYLLLYLLTKRYLPVLWHKVYLTVNILLFLVPLAWFKTLYAEVIHKCFGFKTWYQESNVVKNMMEYTVFVYRDGIYISNVLMYIFAAISIMLGIVGLGVRIKRYFTVYRNIMKGVERFEKGELVINKLTNGYRIPVKSRVYLCAGLKTPITIGIIRGKIILPAVVWEERRLEDVLCHELVHIRVRDNLVKAILTFVALMNFYNPLVYYLLYRWELVTEMYCDEKVIANKSLPETGDYINLLIDFAEMQEMGKLPIAGLNMSEKQLKERIENMKRMKKTGKKFGKMSRLAGGVMIALAVFVSSLTVYAYEERQIRYFDRPYEKVDDFVWYDNWEENGRTELDIKYDAYEKYADAEDITFFVSEEGNVYYDVHMETDQMYRSCSHSYISGTIAKHIKDGKGGCKMEYYDGKKCTKCGHVVLGDFVKTSVYAVCPH